MKGLFVVFEGIDGSGKTTAIERIAQILQEQNFQTIVLREPTEKTDASREIRRILKTVPTMDERIERELFDLFLIDRLWDIEHQIKPALSSGGIVLLDRYFISTAAYQANSSEKVRQIVMDYLDDTRILLPDIIFFLDIPVKTAIDRLSGRNSLDVFESEERLTAIQHRYNGALNILAEIQSGVKIERLSHALADKDFLSMSAKIAKAHTEGNS